MQVIEEGDGSYPSEEEEEEEDVRVPTDITAEGVELIASYWYGTVQYSTTVQYIRGHYRTYTYTPKAFY